MRVFLSTLLFAFLALSGCDSVGIDDDYSPHPCTHCDNGDNDDHPGGDQDGDSDNGGDSDGDGDNGDGDNGDGDTGSDAPRFLEIDLRATYLRVSLNPAEDATRAATAYRLTDLKLSPGEPVCLKAQGDFFYTDGYLASSRSNRLVTAVFSSSNDLGARNDQHRVRGAINAGSDVVTPDAYLGGDATDISEDFDATDVCLTIPADARFIFFSPFDDNFNDNVDARVNGEPFGIRIQK